MNKGKREELRKYLQKLPSRTPLENVTTGDYVELLDALDEAEARLELYRHDSEAMQLSYIEQVDEAERKLAEAEKEVEQRFEFLNEVNESSRP